LSIPPLLFHGYPLSIDLDGTEAKEPGGCSARAARRESAAEKNDRGEALGSREDGRSGAVGKGSGQSARRAKGGEVVEPRTFEQLQRYLAEIQRSEQQFPREHGRATGNGVPVGDVITQGELRAVYEANARIMERVRAGGVIEPGELILRRRSALRIERVGAARAASTG